MPDREDLPERPFGDDASDTGPRPAADRDAAARPPAGGPPADAWTASRPPVGRDAGWSDAAEARSADDEPAPEPFEHLGYPGARADDRPTDGFSTVRPDDGTADGLSTAPPDDGTTDGFSTVRPDDGTADGTSTARADDRTADGVPTADEPSSTPAEVGDVATEGAPAAVAGTPVPASAGDRDMSDSVTGSLAEDETPHRVERRPRADREQKDASFLRELPVLLLVAFVLAFLLRTFVLQVFFIPSASMEPTLMVDDRMVVEKVTFRFREPRRGDIVVFEGETESVPDERGVVGDTLRGVGQFLGVVPASARDFVKRVIGLPGDEIRIEDGLVFVNGVPLDEPYKVDEANDYGPVVVPEDRLFFLGDNRPNSSDSRRGLGMVERDHVVGRAVLILFPFEHAGRLTGVEHEVPEPEAPAPDVGEVPEPDQVPDEVSSLGLLRAAS